MASQVEKEIYKCLEKRENFVLDAGAGSGKTYTLIKALNHIIKEYGQSLNKRKQSVVCITYTNVAKNEILERIEYNSLISVSTIHDFLWDCIKPFQKELKIELEFLIQEKLEKVRSELSELSDRAKKGRQKAIERIEKLSLALDEMSKTVSKIVYANFPNYKEGKFSHDDLIIIGSRIFKKYSIIGKIISDSFPIIFVDEYQDTQKEIVELLLNNANVFNYQVIGFFGDKRQQIYSSGIGEITSAFKLKTIQKTENYRSSIQVIDVLNKLRSDLTQVQPEKNKRTGEALFFYVHTQANESFSVKSFVEDKLLKKWKLNNFNDVKTLYLTHRYIASENEYEDLLMHYSRASKRDTLIDNRNNRGWEPYADFMFDSEALIHYYENDNIQALLQNSSFILNSFEAKQKLRYHLDYLIKCRNRMTVEEFINYMLGHDLLLPTEKMKSIDIINDPLNTFYEPLISMKYQKFINLYQVQEDLTPFSTKHNTKGDEFDNVLVVIDDNAWKSQFNFNHYFSNDDDNESRLNRTANLFYVVCSRAKNNLAILCTSVLSSKSEEVLKEWFGNGYIKLS